LAWKPVSYDEMDLPVGNSQTQIDSSDLDAPSEIEPLQKLACSSLYAENVGPKTHKVTAFNSEMFISNLRQSRQWCAERNEQAPLLTLFGGKREYESATLLTFNSCSSQLDSSPTAPTQATTDKKFTIPSNNEESPTNSTCDRIDVYRHVVLAHRAYSSERKTDKKARVQRLAMQLATARLSIDSNSTTTATDAASNNYSSPPTAASARVDAYRSYAAAHKLYIRDRNNEQKARACKDAKRELDRIRLA
jgi:hypothetical protein